MRIGENTANTIASLREVCGGLALLVCKTRERLPVGDAPVTLALENAYRLLCDAEMRLIKAMQCCETQQRG